MTTRVLICDDSSLARKQMARALPPGPAYRILFASNGAEALATLRAQPVDLMFLDLNMPEVSGYQVLEHTQAEGLAVLTIVVSGDIQPEAQKRVRNLGAIGFIKKPIELGAVLALLAEYGFYRPGELENAALNDDLLDPGDADDFPEIPISLNDYLQEVANIAMGRASDLLARLLHVFVKQPIPRVSLIANSELNMALSAVNNGHTYSAVCQGFTGAGIAGEALLLFADANFGQMAKLLQYESAEGESANVEVLMDLSSILFGAFLKGLGDQLGLQLGPSHPTVLGQHQPVTELLENRSARREQLLCIEISYNLEERGVQCDMLLLLTEDSMPFLEQRLHDLMDKP
ncbi:response regulator [Marinobacter adhaerens]|uniref:Response regulator n=1 Tax=Marinobacter adhaerens TaxID=1033846 RepID=A0A851HW09_9GAMM|nr:response regulator [Marinobacter adhaerens]NWN91766.1 response regulator [Marinobacter adhaerens]